MGKRVRERQQEMWVATTDFPTAAGHPFYTRLNQLLAKSFSESDVEALANEFKVSEQAMTTRLTGHRSTLGRAEKEQRVDHGNVDTIVVDVDHAQHLDPAGVEIPTSASAFDAGRIAGHHLGGEATFGETAW